MTESIDFMFSQLALDGNVWATSIAGIVIILAILFLGVVALGKAKQKIDAFAISVFIFVGILLNTLLGLFNWAYLVVFLIVGLIIIIITKVLGGNANG